MAVSRSASALLLRQRVTALQRILGSARNGDVNAVHRARVATRRLREALPVIDGGKPGRRLARRARELTAVLGPVRELDVALGMLEECARDPEVPAAAIACLRNAIADERRTLHREAVRLIEGLDLPRLQRKALRALEQRDTTERATDRQDRLAAARQRAGRRAARVVAAVEAAGAMYVPERLHDVRIAVKKLRYALEIVGDLAGSRAEARIRMLKRLQDLLGRMHDMEVLIVRTRGLQSAAVRDLGLSSDLDLLVRRLETEARQLHGDYLSARRALLDTCSRVIATAESRRVA